MDIKKGGSVVNEHGIFWAFNGPNCKNFKLLSALADVKSYLLFLDNT